MLGVNQSERIIEKPTPPAITTAKGGQNCPPTNNIKGIKPAMVVKVVLII